VSEQALEMARCTFINLHNMTKMMPAMDLHPLLPLVAEQLRQTIIALDAEDGGEFCTNEWPEMAGGGGA
jgi:hypothetical protein